MKKNRKPWNRGSSKMETAVNKLILSEEETNG